MKMESQTVEVLNTIEIGDHQNEIILTNFEGLTTETVTSSQGNEIVGIFEVQPSGETETILTQGFYIAQGEGENELFLVGVSSDQDNPSEQTVAQFVQSGSVNSTIPIQCADTKIVIGEGVDIVRSSIVESSIDSGTVTCVAEAPHEYQSVLISEEGLNEVTVKGSSGIWAYAEEGSNEKEDVVFIPNSKLSSDAILTALDKNNRKLLQITPVTQKIDEDHDSSEPAHEFIINETVETVTTDQQDQIVSSSCGFNSRKQAADNFNTNNANELSVADAHFSNEGLDLSMNKVVKGVSVIHVTSSSDFTVNNEEFSGVHHKIVEVETEGFSRENANFENSDIHCSNVLDAEQQMTDVIEQNNEMSEEQVLDMSDKYELSEEQDFSNQSVPMDGYICEDNVNHVVVTHDETQVVNEANISNRSSSVLVYSGKEISEQQDSQSIPQDNSLIADEGTTDDSNSMIQFANKNQNYDSAFNSNVNNLSADEIEVRKSVLACKQLDDYSEQEKELSDPCHSLPQEDNSNNMNMETDVNQNINVNVIESEVTRSPQLSRRTSSRRGESVKSNVTVIKSPQKTFSRRSKRQNKSITVSEINTDAEISKQIIDETVQHIHNETVQSVQDDTVHDETDNNSTLASISEEIIDQPAANTPDLVSELSSDSKMDSSANESIDQQPKETIEHLVETNAEMNESPQVSMALCTDVLSNSVPNEAILQPPKKTYLRKRKQLLRSEPISIKDNSNSLDGDIELFSCADLDDRVSSEDVTPIKLSEGNSNMASETNNKTFSSDDDSLLFSSDIRNKGSTTYKRRKTTETRVPDFLESIRKRNVDTIDTSKQNVEDTPVVSEAVTSSEDITAVPEPAASIIEVVSSSNASTPKRPKRVITKKKRYGEDDNSPASKRRAQSLPSAAVAKSLDIENDINEMTAPIAKKNKPKPSSPFVVSETSFYPSASVSFMEQARNKVSKKKQGGSLGGLGKKASPKGVILNHSNGSLTRRQLNDRLNEYNFSDSEETPTEDNVDSRGYSSETFNKRKRSKKYSPKHKGGTSSLTWNKFLKSSPVKIKTTKYLTKIKRKVARLSVDSKEKLSPNSDSKKVHFSPQVREQQVISDNDDDFCQYRIQDSFPTNSAVTTYHCINCEYDTKRVNNYILHLKDCMKSPRVNEEEISDMDRRQQIRGYDSGSQGFSSFSTMEGMEVNHNNSTEERNADDMETDDDSHQEVAEEGFEFSKYDIVWIEVKRVYWPSLVLHVYPAKKKASVYFIDCPLDDGLEKCCTVDVKFLESFDNAEIHKKHMINGRHQKHKDAFVKAVQKAEDFVRKRKCLDLKVIVENYFKGLPKLKKQDGENANDDEFLDVLNLTADIVECVRNGQIDEHLSNVFNGRTESYRHKNFFSNDPTSQKEVAVSPWFGPVTHIDDQTAIYDHICAFFNDYCKPEGNFNVNFYMYHVWCPEVIIKAISEIKGVSIVEAEEMFVDRSTYKLSMIPGGSTDDMCI